MKYRNKLGAWLPYEELQYRFNSLSGALEAGIEIDVEIKKGQDVFSYKGSGDYEAKKNGKVINPEQDSTELGTSLEMLVSDLIIDYARKIGASDKVIEDLVDLNIWSFKSGDLIDEDLENWEEKPAKKAFKD